MKFWTIVAVLSFSPTIAAVWTLWVMRTRTPVSERSEAVRDA